MRKLKEDVRIGMLGAAGGLFSISVFLLVARVDAYYAYLSWLEEKSYATYERGVEDLWWIPIFFWHVLLSVVASLLVHCYLTIFQKSPFLVWQAVGILVLLAWGLTFSVAVGLDCLMRGNIHSLERAMSSVEAGFIAKYVSVVFACNIFFGSAMQASSRQYVEENAS
ncbi:MAG: hypothetical protein AABN95_02435 [Acidobacteriota bacterium]